MTHLDAGARLLGHATTRRAAFHVPELDALAVGGVGALLSVVFPLLMALVAIPTTFLMV